jgi:hypothetical protein
MMNADIIEEVQTKSQGGTHGYNDDKSTSWP